MPRLDVDPHIAGVDRQRKRLGRRQAATEFAVDQQRPHIAEVDPFAHQILDVNAAVAQCATVLVGFGDLGGECHDTFQTWDKIFRNHSHGKILAPHLRAHATGR
jgi:hypothetical protein